VFFCAFVDAFVDRHGSKIKTEEKNKVITFGNSYGK
jgi:hypothetical protein